MGVLNKILSQRARATLMLRIFGMLKVPLISYVKPSVVTIDDEKIVVKISFRRRNRNPLNSIYFGALCVGADCTGGLVAMKYIEERPVRIALVFKDFQADFLKRAEDDTYFTCEQGREISALVDLVSRSEDRQEMAVNVTATVPTKFGDEPVAKFTMTLSLKRR